MDLRRLTTLVGILVTALLTSATVLSQTTEINAGEAQFVRWENTHSLQLNGVVSPRDVEVEWTCPTNADVQFRDPTDPATEVTFLRPGYYQLILSDSNNPDVNDAVIVNVYKLQSYKQRVADLVNLMTVDEKISQLANEADSIPRLEVPEYNYWSEALHGVLYGGVTSFPQAVAMGSTWDPDLLHRVATAISDEARVLHMRDGKGLTYWSPTVNIARDPRWGRNEESYSEDPYLLSEMGVAYVTGMQGDHPDRKSVV